MIKCFITILFLLSFAQPDSISATTVVGKVLRLAPRTKAAQINRYSGRESVASKSTDNDAPPPMAIVYLVGSAKGSYAVPTEHPKMVQQGQAFVPELLPILVGTTVDFPNLDPVFHNVFSYSKAKKFDLGRYPKGHSKSVTFDSPGLVKVFCEIHSAMRAHIWGLEQPYFTVSDTEGNDRIENVPPGEYTLKVWQEPLPEIELKVTIPQKESVTVDVN